MQSDMFPAPTTDAVYDNVNYTVERISPGLLTLASKMRTQPYEALPTAVFQQHCLPQNLSLRPPTHVSQQALLDFYRGLEGDYNARVVYSARDAGFVPNPHRACGVQSEALCSMELLTLDTRSKARGAVEPATAESPAGRAHAPSLAPSSSSSSAQSDDYRLSQFTQNSRHVDTASATRLCLFYNTRGGCSRGSRCPYVHVDKSGTVLQQPRHT